MGSSILFHTTVMQSSNFQLTRFVESTVQNIDDALQKVTNDCDDTTACSLNIQGRDF